MKTIANFFCFCCSILILYAGLNYANNNQRLSVDYFEKETEIDTGNIAQVITVNNNSSVNDITFSARFLTGNNRGNLVQATQGTHGNSLYMPCSVKEHDLVILYPISSNNKTEWLFEDYCRIDKILLLLCTFFIILVWICGKKGITTLLSLFFTFTYIVFILIPLFISGKNGYVATVMISGAIIFSSLFIIHGISAKSITAMLGCWAGLIVSCVLTLLSIWSMKLTGYIGEDSAQLDRIYNGQIDMKAILFAITVLSCLGASMDVAMSISSSLYEVLRNNKTITKKDLYRSGMEIGRDTIGTMSNTLILAYMGGAFTRLIIYFSMEYSMILLLNKQELIAEFVQSLVGVFSILITIPITAALCSFYYCKSG